MTELLAFVGSTTRTDPPKRAGKGIAICRFDDRTGRLDVIEEIDGIDNPSWITVDRARHRLYAASEMGAWNEGMVAAYDFDPASGRLSYINKQPTLGNSTCHLGLSPDGRWLAAANYATKGAGRPDQSVALFALDDGELPPAISRVRHEGRGPNPDRQTRPHAHCAQFTPDSKLLLVVDLGVDRLFAYEIDELGQMVAAPERSFAFEPGRGPRHLAFHPDGQSLFVVHEVRCGITALRLEMGQLRHVQTRDVAYGVLGQPSAIVASPDGRHVYIAVRGPGEIVGFSVEAGGKLEEIGRWPCGGTWPRDMVLTPSGSHLLVCNQDTDNVAVLVRNAETGALGPADRALSIGTPMRLAFA